MCDSGVIIFEVHAYNLEKSQKREASESHVEARAMWLLTLHGSLLDKKEQKRPLRRLNLKRQKEVTYGLKFALNNKNATEWSFFVKTN